MKVRMTAKRKKYVDFVKRIAQPGDVLTYTGCMGELREIVFKEMDGGWMAGIPTSDTVKINNLKRREWINDVAPGAVTHINRQNVEWIPFLNDLEKGRETC